MKPIKKNPVLFGTLIILGLFTLITFLDTAGFYTYIEKSSLWVRQWFGKFYLYLGLGCVLLIIILALSPFGKKKLGGAQTKPEFSLWAWIAMLYSAGMGSGILLRAVQEPVFMWRNPPIQSGLDTKIIALEYTFYQWGFTAWAFYGIFALIIGYSLFKKEGTALVSATISTLQNRAKLRISIDILASLTTVFGLIAAIALGATQITGGLNHLFSQELDIGTAIALTILIATIAFLSVWGGMHKGIKRISQLNILVTLALLLFVFAQGEMVYFLKQLAIAGFAYIKDFIPLSLAIGKYNPGEQFLTDWTYYYWAFWLAWAPFTGIFIARISKGRSIRQLLLGVLLIPSLGTFIWFTVFGESAFSLIEQWESYNGEFNNVFSSIFMFLQHYPMATFLNIVTLILLVGFLVTSADSAVFVLSMFSDKGRINPKKSHRLIWSVSISIFAIALLLLGNAKPDIDVLQALQKLLIITSLPFALFMVVMVSFFLRKIILTYRFKTK